MGDRWAASRPLAGYPPKVFAPTPEAPEAVNMLVGGSGSPLPTDKQARKDTPITSGVLDYFPAALAEVARVSHKGNQQHNPGQPMHHARGKSTDHADCITRHLIERGTIDDDGMRHSAKMAWRALALLQQELEDAGAPLARGAKVEEPELVVYNNTIVGPTPGWCAGLTLTGKRTY